MAKKNTNKPAAVKTLPAAGKKLSLEAYTEKAKQEIEDLVKDLLTDFETRYANAAPETQKLLTEAELEYLEEHRKVLFGLIYDEQDVELFNYALQLARRGIGTEGHAKDRYEKKLSSPVAEVFKEGYAMGIAVTHLKTKVSSGEDGKTAKNERKPFYKQLYKYDIGAICNILKSDNDFSSCKNLTEHCKAVLNYFRIPFEEKDLNTIVKRASNSYTQLGKSEATKKIDAIENSLPDGSQRKTILETLKKIGSPNVNKTT